MTPDQLRAEADARVRQRIAAAARKRHQQAAQRARRDLARHHGLKARHKAREARHQPNATSRTPDHPNTDQPTHHP